MESTYVDYSPVLEKAIDNQEKIIEQLEQQNQILLEQINGFSIIANYLNSFYALVLTLIVVMLLWHILNKWFFRGV